MTNADNLSTGKKKVLIIAHPDWTSAIYESLKPDIMAPPAGVSEASVNAKPGTVAWLCAQIFPTPKDPEKSGALTRAWKALWHPDPEGSIEAQPRRTAGSVASTMSLFIWGAYDFVIIQDVWRLGEGDGATMEGAGYFLANLDYYLWGNFNTKKIILVSDDDFLRKKIQWISQQRRLSLPPNPEEELCAAFDAKQAFEHIPLSGPEAAPVQRIKELIAGDSRTRHVETSKAATRHHVNQSAESHSISKIANAFSYPVMQEALKALRAYVKHHAEVIVVDDEVAELDDTFAQLTGDRLKLPARVGAGNVAVAAASRRSVTQAKNFEELVTVCTQEFASAAQGEKRYTLLVTDILFRGSTWHQTGLDLIERLRDELHVQGSRRVGIVAYTAFTTPFIATSSYQRGADFVVAKTAMGGHDLKMLGTDRLMMTLAFLCFQKSFLFEQRSNAGDLITSSEPRRSGMKEESFERLRQLRRILPKHAVSMHLHQEWLDTCYLLEAINVYGSHQGQLRAIYKDINSKYE